MLSIVLSKDLASILEVFLLFVSLEPGGERRMLDASFLELTVISV